MTRIDARSIVPAGDLARPADARASAREDRRPVLDVVTGDLAAIGLELTVLLDDAETEHAAAQVRHALLDVGEAVRHLGLAADPTGRRSPAPTTRGRVARPTEGGDRGPRSPRAARTLGTGDSSPPVAM